MTNRKKSLRTCLRFRLREERSEGFPGQDKSERKSGACIKYVSILGSLLTRQCALKQVLTALLFTLALTTVAPTLAALPGADSQGNILPTLAPMLDKVTPAVVNISTRGRVRSEDNPLLQDPFFRRFFGAPPDQSPPREQPPQSLGSGVIVDAAKGYILTNNHVIAKAEEVTVTLRDGRTVMAKLVGTDPETDVAVIQIIAKNIVALPIADSEKLRVGDFVVAIGNPFGLGQTVTSGIVSALGRTGLGLEGYENFIQTDASINPGNSGGALVNLRGELVGINTAIYAPGGGSIGIGFAIPTSMAHYIMRQLIEFGEVKRGRLGVQMQNLTPDLAKAFNIEEQQGAVVSKITKGLPADKAGLQVGDIVTTVNGRPVNDATTVRTTVGLMRVGEKINMGIIRNGKHRSVTLILGEAENSMPRLAGATLAPIEKGSPLYQRVEGMIVVNVEANSRAWSARLRKGDIIISINNQPVRTTAELERAIKDSSKRMLLNIRRGNNSMFIVIQ